MASAMKAGVRPLEERRKDLEAYLRGRGGAWSVETIDRPDEHVDVRGDIQALIVSPETLKSRGLMPLRLVVVPHVIAEDFLPIAARHVLAGEIDADGRLLRPLRASVGSLNPVKVSAVERVLSKLVGRVEVTAIEVRSGVPEQPRGEETRKGAMNRAAVDPGRPF